jgi:hypothetical protein
MWFMTTIESSDPRSAIAKALSAFLTEEQTNHLINEVLAIEKRVSVEFACKSCGRRQAQWAMVPDAKAVAGAISDMANQAFGPSQAEKNGQAIHFTRLTRLD